ncbi:MAG TPA: YbaB/EbfC family nucleoid-associated protein [Moheibacter sp.]|nr:YbaB/EbfC family nucleoid-associated protein [Moheibacter sp.]
MFGNIMEMMGKLKSIQGNFEELKNELDSRVFTETSADGNLSITMTELATIQDLKISPELLNDAEQLEDMLVVLLNKSLEKVKKNAIEAAKKTAKESLPPIPGLGL